MTKTAQNTHSLLSTQQWSDDNNRRKVEKGKYGTNEPSVLVLVV